MRFRFLVNKPKILIILGLNILTPKRDKIRYMLIKLSELKEGETGIVVDVKGDAEMKKRFFSMGIIKGAEIKMIRNAPLKDPIEFQIRGYFLSLRRNEAENVIVEVKR